MSSFGGADLSWPGKLLRLLQGKLARVDLRDHEDKILILMALVISAIVGLTVVSFVALTERLGKALVTAGTLQRFLSPVIGSLVGGWLLFRFFPDARGSGIPQTRVALLLNSGVIHIRTVIGKFICSSISLGSGVALGREGPSVHIGAGIASFAGRRLGLSEEHVRSLIPVGTAAAVAAAFNTPLAAVLFTLEEILADLHARVVGSVVIGAATSWIILRMILGDEPLFHVPAYQLVHPLEFLIYALLGIVGGLVSTVFVKFLLWQRAIFLKAPSRWKAFTPAFGGLVVGLLALAVPGVLGVGYNLVSEALTGDLTIRMMLVLLVLKLIATTTCYSSGNAGGIFGPSLFIGAMLGGAIGQGAHYLLPDYTGNAGAYALVGMGAAFAGIVRTPMTSVVMIFEVTRDYTIIVPLMIANLCSYVLAQRLQKHPIYEALSLQEGIRMPSPAHAPDPVTVSRAMRPLTGPGDAISDPVASLEVHPDDTIDSALQIMGNAGIEQIPVVSRSGGAPVGVLHSEDISRVYRTLDSPEERARKEAAAVQNWLPSVAVITILAVLIVSGLVVWQRSRRSAFGAEAHASGERFLAQGQVDEAVAAFRTALAQSPTDIAARATLGLALVQSRRYTEADGYLSGVLKSDPRNARVLVGLAEIARSEGANEKALALYREAFAGDWPPAHRAQKSLAQMAFAALLAESGRRSDAIPLLLTIIEQRGDDPSIAKKAAAMVRSIGPTDETEHAFTVLASRFPGDAGVWLQLGDARLAADKDAAALDAYRKAIQIDPGNPEIQRAAGIVEQTLRLDPTRNGLMVRERVRRWNEILQRVVDATAACLQPADTDPAKALLKTKAVSMEMADQKMTASLRLWKVSGVQCKTDPVLLHVLSKIAE